MRLDEVLTHLNAALSKLNAEDEYLLENNVHERTLCHRLAIFLEQEFPGYNVDCEYNLNRDSEDFRKRIPDFKTKLSHLVGPTTEESYGDEAEELPSLVSVYPDIIIHERCKNDRNLLVIEVKKSTSRVPIESDLIKLRTYTLPGATDFKYDYGVLVRLDIGKEASRHHDTRIFVDGEEIQMPQ